MIEQTPWLESNFLPYQASATCPPGPVVVLAPHPDDEVFGCGGAILVHLAAGDAVSVVIATDSDYGRFQSGEDGRSVRRREAVAAAKVLGYGTPYFWGLPDRGLVYDEGLIGLVLDALEQTAAAILYAPSWWEIHPDHCVLALAAVEAARRCPRPVTLAMYEVGVPLHPNLLLDITDLASRKQAAMACYESQLRMQRYDRHLTALNQFRTYTLSDSVNAAEAFRLLNREDLHKDPLAAIRPGLYYALSRPMSELGLPLVSALFIGGRAALADALDSVMLQTHAHLEIIVVLDRCRDERDLADDLVPWREGRFPLRVIDTDGSLSRAERANSAMANAHGEWLLLLGDGDMLAPSHVATLLASLGASAPARCACAMARVECLRQSGGQPEIADWRLAPEPRSPMSFESVPLAAVLFARSLFEGGCRFDTQFDDRMATWDFWLQLACRTRWIASGEASVRHRGNGSASPETDFPLGSASPGAIQVIEKWLKQGPPGDVARTIWYFMTGFETAMAENQTLVGKWEAAFAENQTLVGKLEAAVAENQALVDRVAALEVDLGRGASLATTLRESLTNCTGQLAEQQRLAVEAEGGRLALQQYVDALHDSTSWRLTRPLRAMAMLLRRTRFGS